MRYYIRFLVPVVFVTILYGCMTRPTDHVVEKNNVRAFEHKPISEHAYVIHILHGQRQIAAKPIGEQSFDDAVIDLESRYEIRYILFAQIGTVADMKRDVDNFSHEIIQGIIIDNSTNIEIAHIERPTLERVFNADYSITYFIEDSRMENVGGSRFQVISFFYKKELGIICQAILTHDNSMDTEETVYLVNSVADSFRFNK